MTNGMVKWKKSLLLKSKFEIYSSLIGYNISSASRELKRIKSLSSTDFYEWREVAKWEVAKYHYKNNPYYRKIVGNKFPSRWEDLPILRKTDFQEKLDRLMSKGYNRRNTYIANTSGSSGHPFFFAKNKEAHAMDWALIKDRYSEHGLDFNSRHARFYGIPLETFANKKEKIKDIIMNRDRFPVFDMSDENLEKHIPKFMRKSYKYIYGYTNSLVLFGEFLKSRNLVLNEICPSLKLCVTTSEVLTQENRNLLTEAFGIKVINEYGASETGIIAFENIYNEWILSEEILYIETIRMEDLATTDNGGNLVVTDLDNKAMPIIRYNIGDIAVISDDYGYNSRRVLKKLIGRENDLIILPSGKKSPGLSFYYISKSILESSGVLKEFIIRQTSVDTFVFDIVSDRNLDNNEISEIRKKMDTYLESNLNLKINRVQSIYRPSSGKIQHFYSEIKN